MIWKGFYPFSIRFSIAFLALFTLGVQQSNAQYISRADLSYNSQNYTASYSFQDDTSSTKYPDPKAVVRRSLIVPGWGQITNKQAWKVPIVYGLLGGLGYYSVYLTKRYHDYRAAYYNSFDTNTDLRFGPTPGYLEGQNPESLRSNRNFLRNRRDFTYVTIFLAYVLNAVDAYVFAHLRPFDVSDDLSSNRKKFEPTSLTSPLIGEIPTVSLKIRF